MTLAAEGSLLALSTGACWALSPICFAAAGRRIGSYRTSLLRLACASAILLLLTPLECLGSHANLIPTPKQTLWIALSGFIGISVGDLLIYESLVRIGPQRTTQMMMFAPVVSTLMAWALMGELLSPRVGCGAALVLLGTGYAVSARPAGSPADAPTGRLPSGLALAFGGAACGGLGAVLQRMAFVSGPAIAVGPATTLRVLSAALFLWTAATVRGDVPSALLGFQNVHARNRLLLGSLAGTVVGMLFFVSALKTVPAGLVSALTATSPLFVLVMLSVRRRTAVPLNLLIASGTALAGVGLICVR